MAEMRNQLESLLGRATTNQGARVADSQKNNWDPERATVRCLAHIIHLAVMALLAGAKAIPSSTPVVLEDASPMTEEDAEGLNPLPDSVAESNEDRLAMYYQNPGFGDADDIDLSSPIEKVS